MRRLLVVALACSASFVFVPVAGAAVAHTVTFAENLGQGPSVVAYQASVEAAPLTDVQDLRPFFANPGFGFKNWNTKPNGSGVTFANGQTYSFSSNITLYAQWLAPFHSVTFNENRSTSDQTTAVQSANSPTTLINFANLIPQFSNPGFNFVGWNTAANGSGTNFANSSKYSFATPLALYAQWKKIPAKQASLVLVGVLGGNSRQNLSTIATSLIKMKASSVEILQCGTNAPSGTRIASRLTQLLLGRPDHAVSVAFRGFAATSGPSVTEVFATALVPNFH